MAIGKNIKHKMCPTITIDNKNTMCGFVSTYWD
jgi:hypothetical protein